MNSRKLLGLFLALIVILACFLFNFAIGYLKTKSFLSFKRWDINSATAADFTIELRIPMKAYTEWVKDHNPRDFKQHLQS